MEPSPPSPPRPSSFGPRERRCGAGDSGRLGGDTATGRPNGPISGRPSRLGARNGPSHLQSPPVTPLCLAWFGASTGGREISLQRTTDSDQSPSLVLSVESRFSFFHLFSSLLFRFGPAARSSLAIPASPYKSTSCSGQSPSSVPPAAASPLLDPSSGVAAQPTKFNTPHPTSSVQGRFSLHHSWSHSSHDDRCLGLGA